jgi:uncharacterized RDD family membrane protein YckC
MTNDSPSLTRRAFDIAVCVGLDVALGKWMGFGFDWLAIGASLNWLYFACSLVLTGTTIGKRVVGLAVVGPTGDKPTLGDALRRELFTIVGAIPLVGPLLAFASWIAIATSARKNPDGRGPHDRFAGGTRVVARYA